MVPADSKKAPGLCPTAAPRPVDFKAGPEAVRQLPQEAEAGKVPGEGPGTSIVTARTHITRGELCASLLHILTHSSIQNLSHIACDVNETPYIVQITT